MSVKITQEIYDKLKAELDELLRTKKPQAMESLKKAIAEGDISESSDYEAAKDEIGVIDGRIAEIRDKLANAEIVEYENGKSNAVQLGSTVEVEVNGQRQSFVVVLPDDVDLTSDKISNDSPVGRALFGKKEGELVTVETPSGMFDYKIVSIR